MTKKHTKSSIKALLTRSDAAVERALVVLYDRQTQDEKRADRTKHHNNRGFNHGDAKALGYWARLVKSERELFPNTLNQARRRLMKYAGQLAVIANEKAAKAQAGKEADEFAARIPGPMPGTWAHTARIMAAGDTSGFDWDRWKDEMKEANC